MDLALRLLRAFHSFLVLLCSVLCSPTPQPPQKEEAPRLGFGRKFHEGIVYRGGGRSRGTSRWLELPGTSNSEKLLPLLSLKGKAGAGEAWGMERAMAGGTLVEGCGHIRSQCEAGEEEEETPKLSPPYLSSPAESPLGTAPRGARKQGTSVM